MEKLKLSNNTLLKALKTFNEAVQSFEDIEKIGGWNDKNRLEFSNYEKIRDQLRDSTIQRFEFCVDLFWKYIKKYLEFSLKKPSEMNTPRHVVLSACKAELISELDASKIINMIKDRNQTSHIYKEELAEDLIVKIPGYYKLMYKYVAILKP